MPIEFPCPVCHQQVRTPDAAAGKKGKCPTCGTLLIIPSPAVAFPQLLPEPSHQQPFQPPGIQQQPMLPRPKAPPPKPEPASPPSTPVLTPPPTPPAPGTVEFTCPSCNKLVRTPAAMAGRKGRCPNCDAVVQIPSKPSGPTPKPGAKLPTAKPLSMTPARPATEAEIIDLEELPEDPAPVSRPAPVPGLTPLGPLPPVPAPVPGLTPIPSEMLAGLSGPNPLGLPPSALVGATQNPFAGTPSDPYASPAYAASYYTPPISDAGRRGLAWEREPSMESFTDTLNEVLGASQDTFQRMRRTGGVGNPLMFLVIGMVISQIANALYSVIFNAIVLASRGGPFPIEALVIVGAIQLIGGLVGVVVLTPILAFIVAGIYHVLLVMVGGANAGYEATLRCVCFTYGSTAVLNAIPILGPIIGFFYGIIVLIHAFAQAHETSGSKASFAVLIVLLPIVLCGCGALLIFGLSAISAAG